MCAQREAEHGRMCRSGRFCTLSTAQAQPQPHEALKSGANPNRFSPLVVVLLEHRPLSSVAYPLKLFDELIIGLTRLFDRNIIRLTKANGLKQLASNFLHRISCSEVDVIWVWITVFHDDAADFCDGFF